MLPRLLKKRGVIIGVGLLLCLVSLALVSAQAYSAEKAPNGYLPGDDVPDIYAFEIGSAHYQLNWNIMACGGGKIDSTHYTLNSTIGQPTIGTKGSDHYEECTGYWCGLKDLLNFLPQIVRQ